MQKSKFTLKIENRLARIAPKKFKGKFKPEDFLKGQNSEISRLKFLNMKMPVLRNELDTLFSTKTESHGEHLFEDMQNLWFESDVFDAKIIALYWLDKQNINFLIKNHRHVLSWTSEIDNWAHSDTLCSIYARMFEHSQKLLLPTYLKWNKHPNSWLRRCSMVGTFYYSYHREKPAPFSLAKKLVTPHFTAKEYYVQKGVGWTIREMYNVYPNETIGFIENNLHKLTPIAWVAASEKLPAKIKTPLLKKRKLLRKK